MYIIKRGKLDVVADDGVKVASETLFQMRNIRILKFKTCIHLYSEFLSPLHRKKLLLYLYSQVFVTLGEGVVFGEISILNIPGRCQQILSIFSIFFNSFPPAKWEIEEQLTCEVLDTPIFSH